MRIPETNKSLIAVAMAGLLGLAACRQAEFMPPQEGEEIPFTDTTSAFYQAFSTSPYTLFFQAWRRSEVPANIQAQQRKAKFTLFVPTNAALEAAGYDLATISRMPLPELNALVAYHTTLGQFGTLGLGQLEGNGNTGLFTMLSNGNYLFPLYIGVENGAVFLQGKPSGQLADVLESRQATLIPLDRVLRYPQLTTYQWLEQDGRFGLYLQLLDRFDGVYNEVMERAWSYYGERYRTQWFNGLGYTTVLAPTDEAFHRAGIRSMEDVDRINARVFPPYYNTNTTPFNLSHYYPVDSLLNNHWWQLGTATPGRTAGNGGAGIVASHRLHFSNDLKRGLLSTGSTAESSYLEFMWTNDDGLQLKVNGAAFAPATVIEQDIVTLTGVVHVVDRLLLPPGFELD